MLKTNAKKQYNCFVNVVIYTYYLNGGFMAIAEFTVNKKEILSLADEVDRLKLISKFFEYSTEATKSRIRRRFLSSLNCGDTKEELLAQKVSMGMLTINYGSRKIDDKKKIKKAFYDNLRSEKNKKLSNSDQFKITEDRFLKTTCDFSLMYANEDVSLMLNRMYRLLSDIRSGNDALYSYLKNDFVKGRDEEIFVRRKIISDKLLAMFKDKKAELIQSLKNEGYDVDSPLVRVRLGQFKTKVIEYPEVRYSDFVTLLEQREEGGVGDFFKKESLSVMVSTPKGYKSGLAAAYGSMKAMYDELAESLIKNTIEASSPLILIPEMKSFEIQTSVQKDVSEVRNRNSVDEFDI